MKFNFPSYTVPPDGFIYVVLEDGRRIEATDIRAWHNAIQKHYADNGYALPVDWKERAEDQRCRTLPPGWCLHEDGRMEYDGVNIRMEIGDWYRGMEVLASVVADGDALVEKAIADKRAAICASCPANVAIPGCHSCHKVSNAILAIKGSGATEHDHLLKACAVCKCGNAAQVWVKHEHLARGVTPEMMRSFALLPHCWKKAALDAQSDACFPD